MTRISLLGSGSVAQALTRPLGTHGHSVVIGSRDPSRVLWADGAGAQVATLDDAAASAELVINALPGGVSLEVLSRLRSALEGKVLIDVANAVRVDSDGFATELLYPGGSLAEEIQLALPETDVVKALNTMHVSLMTRSDLVPSSPAVFLSGNSAQAKRGTERLMKDLGWLPENIFDLGPIDTARWSEHFVLAIRPLINILGPVPFGLAIAR
jgi:predicted dinucleotide-binding enzyme